VARRALATLLSACGYEIAAASSAEEALDLLRHRPPQGDRQIALVDLNLPGMNGLEFITHLQRMSPDAFPVLMTASAEECVGKAVRDGRLACLRKPLDLGQLLTLITHAEPKH
jgi:CheY-like chemotaxis protein